MPQRVVKEIQEGKLTEGDIVEFEIGEGQKGACAKNIRTLKRKD